MRNDRIIQYTAHTGTAGELISDIKMNYSWEANAEYEVCSLICHNMNKLEGSTNLMNVALGRKDLVLHVIFFLQFFLNNPKDLVY